MDEQQAKAERDALRDFALNDVDYEPVLVEHKGKVFEVRPPTYEQTRSFIRDAKDRKTGDVDAIKMGLLAVIACTYHRGSELKVFQRTDEELLLQKRKSKTSLVGKLEKALEDFLSSPEEVEKNSESAPTT